MNLFHIDHGKKNQEKDGGSKNIHPDGIQVADPAARHIFPGKKSGFGKQILDGYKKFSVKMGNIRKKVGDQVPNGLFWLDIFLSTDRAIPAVGFSSAVKAYLFRSYLAV